MTPKILIVDDVPANLIALRALLRGLDVDVQVVDAGSGGAALEQVLEHDFALILTDVQMPGMDGFELASILQGHDEWNQIPIIFITAAYKDEQNRDRGYATGAVDYIQKPIEEHILLSKVTIFLKMYEQRQYIENTNADLEARVQARTAELARTESLAKIGGWRIDPQNWTEKLSQQMLRILSGSYDVPPEAHAEITSLFSFMDQESRDYHLGKIKKIAVEKGLKYDFEIEIRNLIGDQCHVFCTTEFVYDEGELQKIEGTAQDITERQRAKDIIQYLEMHDPLTSLPSRSAFQENIVEAISDARQTAETLAVLLIDLDNFKDINDSHGQAIGDLVLTEIGHRLGEVTTKEEQLSRFGGDEFSFIIPNVESLDHVVQRAEACLTVLNEKFSFFPDNLGASAGIGIAMFPQDADNVDGILKAADLALQRSKSDGGNGYNFYDNEMSQAYHRRNDNKRRLANAIENKEFELYYQPKIDLKSNEITGAEALIRWNDPVMGMVPPDDFIPLAEETGLICPLGRWIVEDACATSVRWKKEFGRNIPIAINVSVEQIKSVDFAIFLEKTMKNCGATADMIEIEITETTLLESTELTGQTLRRIKAMGVDIALDDFGTGYSSLTHLKALLATTLKIDRSFIQHILTDTSDAHIADMVISVAHKLDMKVVAEGIEEQDQCNLLKSINCDVGQGYFYSKPLPELEFIAWVKNAKLD